MKRATFILSLLSVVLIFGAPFAVHAKDKEDGFWRNILPFLPRSDTTQTEPREDPGVATTSAPLSPAVVPTQEIPSPLPIEVQNPTQPRESATSSTSGTATATPLAVLNTQQGGGSPLYEEQGLSQGQSTLLFIFSIGLALAGLLLAEGPILRPPERGTTIVTTSPKPAVPNI